MKEYRISTFFTFGLMLMLAWAGGTSSAQGQSVDTLRISTVFNNVSSAPGLKTAWGFAAVVEGPEYRLLFDTGADGALLLTNMDRMGIDAQAIDGVFLSHFHRDHTGGLKGFLRRKSAVTVYLPASFPPQFQRSTAKRGARVVSISEPSTLFEGVYSTGPMGGTTKEQALILDTPTGLVVITGCAHPGIVEIVRAAKRQRGKAVRLLVGGFHLLRQSKARIRVIIDDLKALGVAQVAPSHCTGGAAIALFREAWGTDFVDGGCGAVIDLDR